jgi:multidrug efflux pump subunit AcrB
LSGKTINTISLSSIAIASGMVVDNAIVIVDNICRRIERGNRPREAAIFGTKEMFLAVAASTLTTIVVFMPMLFVTGVVGIMFGELAVIVTVTLLASLFTAATFSPMLCSQWLKADRRAQAGRSVFQKFYDFSERMFLAWENFYARILAWCLGHKKTVLIGFIFAFFVSLTMARFVGTEFIPEEDTGDVRAFVHLPIGTRVEETGLVARKIEDIFDQEVPEKRYMFVRFGQVAGIGRTSGQASGSHVIYCGVKLVPKTERKRSAKDVAQVVRSRITSIPGVLKLDISTGSPLGQLITGTGGKSVQIDIIGHSYEETDQVALQVKNMLERIPGSVDVIVSRDNKRPELRIEVDRQKIGVLGLDMETIAQSVKAYIEGSIATRYREKGQTYDITVRLQEGYRTKLEDIENLSVTSPLTGQAIKLANIARIIKTVGPEEIERLNRERVLHVSCNTYKRSPGKIIEDLEAELKKLPLPSGVVINIGGEAEEQVKAFKDLFILLLLGICLVYMVMAAQFESLLDPFIIMFAVPFTFMGVIFGLFVTGLTLSVVSFLGVVMLMGIVVNNAIVLISYINILRARGFSIYEAITQGGRDRLRPVLMTTITTLVGLLPLALSRGEGSETWQPLGVTMIGGLTVSTFITLLFVPTLYAVFESRVKKNGGPKHA